MFPLFSTETIKYVRFKRDLPVYKINFFRYQSNCSELQLFILFSSKYEVQGISEEIYVAVEILEILWKSMIIETMLKCKNRFLNKEFGGDFFVN